LLVSKEKSFLSTLEGTHKSGCPVTGCRARHTSQRINAPSGEHITNHREIDDLFLKREAELMEMKAGEVWSALAGASRPAILPTSTPSPKGPRRGSRRVVKEDYVDTNEVIDSSPYRPSSQTNSATSAEFDVSFEVNTVDVDDQELVRNVPEIVTLRLVQAFLRYALLRCLDQTDPARELRVRVSPVRRSITVQDVLSIASVDDGRICRMLLHSNQWVTESNMVAILEAKKALKVIDQYGRPAVTNETLAQYLGEAVAAWHMNKQFVGNE
jgi:hypothetical protein